MGIGNRTSVGEAMIQTKVQVTVGDILVLKTGAGERVYRFITYRNEGSKTTYGCIDLKRGKTLFVFDSVQAIIGRYKSKGWEIQNVYSGIQELIEEEK